MTVPSIRLVTLWGGPLPKYLPLFLGTAARNPTVEFVFVADSPQPYVVPRNVRWVEMSMPDLLSAMGSRLGCDVSRAAPYKLCDLKPAFGVALADLLDGCDFWGHVDCDIVLGDLRAFANEEQLARNDVLSFWGHGFIHGPLTIWRNVDNINQLYRRADWRQAFEADDYVGFDETGKRWSRAARRPIPVAERRARGELACITDVVYEAAAQGSVRVYDQLHIVQARPRAQRQKIALRWKGRGLTKAEDGEPLAFFHIHWAKSDAERGDPAYVLPAWRWDELPEQFAITRRHIGVIDTTFRVAYVNSLAATLSGRLHDRARRIRDSLPTALKIFHPRRTRQPSPAE